MFIAYSQGENSNLHIIYKVLSLSKADLTDVPLSRNVNPALNEGLVYIETY